MIQTVNQENMPATYHFGLKILFDGCLITSKILCDGYVITNEKRARDNFPEEAVFCPQKLAGRGDNNGDQSGRRGGD